jgi:hypothetical protein
VHSAGARGLIVTQHHVNTLGLDTYGMDDLTTKLLAATRAAEPRWQQARTLAVKARTLAPAGRLEFFQANILTQVDLHLHFNRMLIDLAEMAQAQSVPDKIAKMRSGIREGEAAQAAMHAAEYGKWKGFYSEGDWLLDTPLTLALERTFLDHLQGRPLDENIVIRARRYRVRLSHVHGVSGNAIGVVLRVATRPADRRARRDCHERSSGRRD